jgi:hypothetical protein
VKIQPWDREGLERLIRYCARPCFASENLRWNGQWLVYRLSKPTYKGQTFIQLEPLDFLNRIASLIPLPKRHRRHYHGVFAPNAPLRKQVIAYAKRHIGQQVPPDVREIVEKIRKVSLDWARLIARIYEVNPLLCSRCGQTIKIIGFVTHAAEIQRILKGIGWPIKTYDFDPPYDFQDMDVCQLISGTSDGFPEMDSQDYCYNGPDPPLGENNNEPPWWNDFSDPPHCEDNVDLPHEND